MKNYEHLTEALQAALMMATRGYVQGVSFEVEASKLDTISAKFADTYGVNLPAWKRHDRRSKGLPNAWACSMPVAGNPAKRLVVLLATDFDEGKLDAASPWLREKWKPLDRLEIGDIVIKRDQRERGDSALTVRLSPRCQGGLEKYWRALAAQGHFDQIAYEAGRAVRFYPLFGGLRRQLRRMIRGYAKLYEKKLGKQWPGPNPENLPAMVGFSQCADRRKRQAPPLQSDSAATAAGGEP